MVDGIDGIVRPPNLLSLTNMLIYNGIAITPIPNGLSMAISNYYNTAATSTLPTIPMLLNLQLGSSSTTSYSIYVLL